MTVSPEHIDPKVDSSAATGAATRNIARPAIEDVTADTEFDERIAELLAQSEQARPEDIATVVQELPPGDAADALEQFDTEEAANVVVRMTDEEAAQDIAAMETPLAVEILNQILVDTGPDTVARYIDQMPKDDAVDILQAVPEEQREKILDALPPANVVALKQLMTFDPETAGGMMSHEFLRIDSSLNAADAIQVIRDHPRIDFTQVYCIDERQHLLGVISPRDLLVAPADTPVVDLMDKDHVGYLRPETDQEEAAAVFERYDLHEMPVVDSASRLLGVVTVDDVLDVIRLEHTEDAYKMVGAGRTEAVYSGLWVKFRGRLPWLLVNVVTSLVAGLVVFQFDNLIAELAILAVLMPIIANQAGNAGQQSLAVTMRGLALGELRGNRAWPLVRREITVGILNGSLVGSMVGLLIILIALTGIRDIPWELGIVVAVAMTVSVATGCLVGSAMPMIINRLKHDPATASTIFLTMVTDSISFVTFLGLSWILHNALIS